MTLRVHKSRGISRLAERVLSFQKDNQP
jgi:hypothetical protein